MAFGVPEECSIKEFKNSITARMYKKINHVTLKHTLVQIEMIFPYINRQRPPSVTAAEVKHLGLK